MQKSPLALAALLLAACNSAAGDRETVKATVPSATVLPTANRAPEASTPDLAAAAPAPAPSASAMPGKLEVSLAKQMALSLVGHATLDGHDVTGVRAIDKCHTAFVTATGETVIDWTKADNSAAHDADGRENTELPGSDGKHVMSVVLGDLPEPAGNAANRTSGAFGGLAIECAGLGLK